MSVDTEDVLSSRTTHYWSADGRYICYAELNDTGVPLQAWPWYGHRAHVYVQTVYVAYPKVLRVDSLPRNVSPASQFTIRYEMLFYKKLSYRRGTARCVVSIEILPIATQQCRNYL